MRYIGQRDIDELALHEDCRARETKAWRKAYAESERRQRAEYSRDIWKLRALWLVFVLVIALPFTAWWTS